MLRRKTTISVEIILTLSLVFLLSCAVSKTPPPQSLDSLDKPGGIIIVLDGPTSDKVKLSLASKGKHDNIGTTDFPDSFYSYVPAGKYFLEIKHLEDFYNKSGVDPVSYYIQLEGKMKMLSFVYFDGAGKIAKSQNLTGEKANDLLGQIRAGNKLTNSQVEDYLGTLPSSHQAGDMPTDMQKYAQKTEGCEKDSDCKQGAVCFNSRCRFLNDKKESEPEKVSKTEPDNKEPENTETENKEPEKVTEPDNKEPENTETEKIAEPEKTEPEPVEEPKPIHPPLDLMPDDGLENPVHEQYAGQIVFAKKRDIMDLNAEQPDKFTNSFKLTDEIHFRVYLNMSLRNHFRSEGIDCHPKDDKWRVYKMTIDGKPIGKDGVLYNHSAKGDAYKKWATFRFKAPLNGKAEQGERSIQREFITRVTPELTEGKHDIKLILTGRCMAKNLGNETMTLSKPIAVGEFTLDIKGKELKKLVKKYGQQWPKAKFKNKKLAKEMKKIMVKEWPDERVLGLVIVGQDWEYEYEAISGRVLERKIVATVGVEQDPGKCMLFDLLFTQEAISKKKFGPTKFFGVGGNIAIPCSNVPKYKPMKKSDLKKWEENSQKREQLAVKKKNQQIELKSVTYLPSIELKSKQQEAERLEAEQLEKERLEAERLEKERLEAEKLEAEKLEAERLEKERLDAEKSEAEKLEAEKIEAERLEKERLDAEKLEAEKLDAEKSEAEKLEAERLEKERLDAEKLEAEKKEAESGESMPVPDPEELAEVMPVPETEKTEDTMPEPEVVVPPKPILTYRCNWTAMRNKVEGNFETTSPELAMNNVCPFAIDCACKQVK